MLKVNYNKFHTYYTPEGEKIEGLEGPDKSIYKWVHYNKFEDCSTPIPEGSSKVKMSIEWIEENFYGTKEYVPYINSYFYNIKNKLTDHHYKKYFVGDNKYMVCISKFGDLKIYDIPTNIICGDLDHTMEGRYHLREIKRYRYVIINYSSTVRDSMLIRIYEFHYVFIGKTIYEFDFGVYVDSFGDNYIVINEEKIFIK